MTNETSTQSQPKGTSGFARFINGMFNTLCILALTVVAVVGGCYLFLGKEGAEVAKNLVQARVTLAQASVPVPTISRWVAPFRVLKTGHVDLTASVSAGGEANVYIVRADQIRNLESGNRWSYIQGFGAPDMTATRALSGTLEAGEYCLLIQNENIFHRIQVDFTVIEDFKR